MYFICQKVVFQKALYQGCLPFATATGKSLPMTSTPILIMLIGEAQMGKFTWCPKTVVERETRDTSFNT